MVVGIPSTDIWIYWNQIEDLLDLPFSRMKAYRRYTKDGIKGRLIRREWQCWAAVSKTGIFDAIVVAATIPLDTGYNELKVFFVGGQFKNDDLLEFWETMKGHAEANNCKWISGAGRKGWARALPDEIETEYGFMYQV